MGSAQITVEQAMPSVEPLGPHMLDFVSHSATQTHRLGVRLGRLLRPGDVLLFAGEYGAGKTTFIQGIAEGLGVLGPVTSPSFTLIWEYRSAAEHGATPFYHIDLYRIRSPEEALALGLEDYLYGLGVCAVEWADRFLEVMPAERLHIHLAFLSETKRVVRITPTGPRYEELAEGFKQSAFGH
jgi:tRNA threonylcarbamoyladenosine biosynthesis protein TsaE